jgi:hypothetical protein
MSDERARQWLAGAAEEWRRGATPLCTPEFVREAGLRAVDPIPPMQLSDGTWHAVEPMRVEAYAVLLDGSVITIPVGRKP